MTTEKAIEILNGLLTGTPTFSFEQMTAIQVAKTAMERDLPHKKKVIRADRFCTYCKSRVRQTDRYCPVCGVRLEME